VADGLKALDPNRPIREATLAVHCGNGFDAGFSPYQSTRLSRYNAVCWAWGSEMKRREFIQALGGAAVFPLAAHAQQRGPMRRVGVLMNVAADDPESAARIAAFLKELQQLGWSDGRNVQIDTRWAVGDVDRFRQYAAELIALAPDVVLASSSLAVAALQKVTGTVPIVFVGVVDPVGAGFVDSLAHPGGNTTGFTNFEYGLSGKWLELLKEIVPPVKRVAVLRDPASPAESGMFTAIQSAAPSFGVVLSPFGMRDAGEIESAITAFARDSNGGLIVLGSSLANVHRELIVTLAASHRLPAVYSDRIFVTSGGLISYGPNRIDQFQRGAVYVDRILKGEKPFDLPVQAPTKYELFINLKTAKALGLTVPPTLLALADDVIE
jgi:putative ABC transport system substrate-binding protein